jgi:hypothetical protein
VSGGPPGEQVPGPWVVPKDFKRAIVHPVYKGSSKPGAEPGSYRPVSILTELSKVLEVVVKEDLEAHLDNLGSLPNTQHRFCRGRSCTTALATAHARWMAAGREKKVVGILAFDLSAAFDTVAKDQLLPKLAKLGTAGNALRWFNSYMSGGRKVVVWNGVKSDPVGMVYGVRQGSILGPLLYNVHVADMPACLDVGKEYNTGYADNTKAWQVGDTLENVAASLQRVADRFAAYTKGNGPSLNAAKTQLMFNKKADGCSCRGRRIHQPGLQPRAAGGQVRPTPHHTALREGPGEGGEDESVSHLEAGAPPPPW